MCIADVDVVEGENALVDARKQFGETEVTFRKCDVTSDVDFEAAVVETKRAFGGRLDILINNAGIIGIDEANANWSQTVDINLKGVMRGTFLALEHLTDGNGKRGGVVINTSSITGVRPSAVGAVYSATKFGVNGWTKSIGHEVNFLRTGVRVNAVCPKSVDTRMIAGALLMRHKSDLHERVCQNIEETMMAPSVVAEGFLKVLDDDVTGAVLIVEPDRTYYHVSEDDKL